MRYTAVIGLRIIASSNNLVDIISKISNKKIAVGSDVVVWDTGTITNPIMQVAASTCGGWFNIKLNDVKYWSEIFNISISPKETAAIKSLFDSIKVDKNRNVSDVLMNLYEASFFDYEALGLTSEEFKILFNKLFNIVK